MNQESESAEEEAFEESSKMQMTRQMQKHYAKVKDSNEFKKLLDELSLVPLAVYYSYKKKTSKYAQNTLLNDKLFLRRISKLLTEAHQ